MKKLAIKAENISKQYRLGEVGTGTLSHDLNRFWHKVRGKENPYLMIGETNDRTTKSSSDYVWSLKDINFEIEQGDAVGIIGRNGAGKSTLLKILSKVTKPTTGNIKVNGRIASLLEVGTGFNPEMTGRENIYLNGAILGMRRTEIRRKLDEIIDFSGVERYIDTPVKRYSSGMYVRLAFAVAAHLESEILIVDEVLAVGDAEFQKKCLGKMGDVSKGEGRTVLFVSHNMASVQNLCKKVMILNRGCSEDLLEAEAGILEYMEQDKMRTNTINSKMIKRVDILDENLNSINVLKIEGEVHFKFYLNDEFDLRDYDLGFFLLDKFGDKLSSVSTSFKKPSLRNDEENEKTIQFVLKDLKLIDGTYRIDISIVSKGGKRVEFLEDAIRFQVNSNDFYKSGTVLSDYFGKFYLDYDYYV